MSSVLTSIYMYVGDKYSMCLIFVFWADSKLFFTPSYVGSHLLLSSNGKDGIHL